MGIPNPKLVRINLDECVIGMNQREEKILGGKQVVYNEGKYGSQVNKD